MTDLTIVNSAFLVFFLLGSFFCVYFGYKINKLYANKKHLETLLDDFVSHTKAREESLERLELKTKRLYKNWEEALQKGDELKNDLSYFIERGQALLTDMEPRIKELRDTHVEQSVTDISPLVQKKPTEPAALHNLEALLQKKLG